MTVVVSCLCIQDRAVNKLVALHWRRERSHREGFQIRMRVEMLGTVASWVRGGCNTLSIELHKWEVWYVSKVLTLSLVIKPFLPTLFVRLPA